MVNSQPPRFNGFRERQVKFFSVWTNWTWYITEFDGEDVFFDLVEGFEREWATSTSRSKFGRKLERLVLESLRGPFGVKAVERDLYFEPISVSFRRLRWRLAFCAGSLSDE